MQAYCVKECESCILHAADEQRALWSSSDEVFAETARRLQAIVVPAEQSDTHSRPHFKVEIALAVFRVAASRFHVLVRVHLHAWLL